MKKFEEIEVTEEEKSLRRPGAYCFCFVYSPKGNFVVKGKTQSVLNYVKKEFPLCFYNLTLFRKKGKMSHWHANGIELKYNYVCQNSRNGFFKRPKRRGWNFVVRLKREEFKLYFRRFPKFWPEKLTLFVSMQDEFTVASDLCEEKGLIHAAKLLRRYCVGTSEP